MNLGRIHFLDNPQPYVPLVFYTQRLQKTKFDKQFIKFLKVFKKLPINILYANTLAKMPNYVKFIKDILSNKRKLEEFKTITLIEDYNAIL